jgi:hypothetical protein
MANLRMAFRRAAKLLCHIFIAMSADSSRVFFKQYHYNRQNPPLQ